jgi:GAF domain-containing protein
MIFALCAAAIALLAGMLLGIQVVRSVWRPGSSEPQFAGLSAERRLAAALDAVLDDAADRLRLERGSAFLLDRAGSRYVERAVRGRGKAGPRRSRDADNAGLLGWVAQMQRPLIIDGRALPPDVAALLHQPALRTSVIMPVIRHGRTVAVLSLSTQRNARVAAEHMAWLQRRIESAVEQAHEQRNLSVSLLAAP